MEMEIILIGTDEKETQNLRRLLERQKIQVTIEKNDMNLSHLSQRIQDSDCQAFLIDLDTMPHETNFFRDLKKKNPSLNIMGLSDRPFHPELEEAITSYMYACLKKPVDEDEFLYLIKSIYKNDPVQEKRSEE